MQKNPGAKTIEGDLEEALFRAGAVPEQDRNCPKRYDWARSARTDKGVSAVGQVVSGRFYVDPPGFVERLNSELPSQFRIFGYKRVTGSFSAKKFCDRRRYVYLIPVFALDPSSHRDRESVLASLGEEEKERFNRILSYYVGSHNFHNFTTRTKAEDPAAWRYIVSFTANTVVTVDGIEFVKCEVIGQSFMLHQIRKLMGVAVAIMRNCAPESLIKTALQK
ncbi:Pseudouridylate synthase 1 homolog [Linum perenne]